MPILRIQHSVTSFDAWKRTFDSDPVDRKGCGVRRYRILRSVSGPDFVMVDLELDTVSAAEALLQKLERLWNGPAKDVMRGPEARIVETVQSIEL